MLEEEITLNDWSIGLISPASLLAFIVVKILYWAKYSPHRVLRDNYIKCYEVVEIYSKWILKEKEYYVGKRGWNMANSFLLKKTRFMKKIKRITHNEIISMMLNDILVDEGLSIRERGQHISPDIYPKEVPIPALTKTTYCSEKHRYVLVFNEFFESMKERRKLIFVEKEGRKENATGRTEEENSKA